MVEGSVARVNVKSRSCPLGVKGSIGNRLHKKISSVSVAHITEDVIGRGLIETPHHSEQKKRRKT